MERSDEKYYVANDKLEKSKRDLSVCVDEVITRLGESCASLEDT